MENNENTVSNGGGSNEEKMRSGRGDDGVEVMDDCMERGEGIDWELSGELRGC